MNKKLGNRDHRGMVDYCSDMDTEHLSHMLNNHYTEFTHAYKSISEAVDNGRADVKFEVLDNELVAIVSKADMSCIDDITDTMNSSDMFATIEKCESCTKLHLHMR